MGHSFHGFHGAPFAGHPQQEARENWLPVHQNSARPTLAELAPVLRAGQSEIFSEDLNKVLCGANEASVGSPFTSSEIRTFSTGLIRVFPKKELLRLLREKLLDRKSTRLNSSH